MMSLLKKVGILVFMFLAVACGKAQTADPGAGAQNVYPIPANNCLPDQNGNLPANCNQPSTASMNANGDLIAITELSTIPFLEDSAGRLEIQWNPGQLSSLQAAPYRCHSGGGVGGFLTGKTCERDCKSFKGGGQIQVQILNGSGLLTFKAGPYRNPGLLCDRSLNNSYYTIQVPVWIETSPDSRGFTIRTTNGGWSRVLSIIVDEGIINSNQTTFSGKVFYNSALLGSVELFRRI